MPPHRPDQRRRIACHGLWCLAMLVATIVMIGTRPAVAAPVTIGGPFTLRAPDGTLVTDQTYRGKWLLVFFGFTFCPDTCPTTLLEVAAALKRLGPDASRVQPVFITVDPQRDTPAVVGNYVASFDPRIVGLTGTAEQIAAVAKEYGIYYAPRRFGPGPEDYAMDHDAYVYLMDRQGKFARAFDPDTPGEDIAEAIRDSWREAGGSGVN